MRERETPSDPGEESGRRRISIIAWVSAVAVSFALGALVTHFAMLREPISQYSFQAFFASPFWSTASIALVCFVSGIGYAYIPFSWYRDDATRTLRTEYRDLREKADALRDRADGCATRQSGCAARTTVRSRRQSPSSRRRSLSTPSHDEAPQDIAAVISEMSAAIKANLRDTGPARPDGRGSADRRSDPHPSGD